MKKGYYRCRRCKHIVKSYEHTKAECDSNYLDSNKYGNINNYPKLCNYKGCFEYAMASGFCPVHSHMGVEE